jgi:hypothetical protein
MTQPFDNRDWDARQIAEKEAEIARLKGWIALLTPNDYTYSLSSEIERLKNALRAADKVADGLRELLTRAADALEYWNELPESRAKFIPLIAELRKAAQ